MKAAIVAVAMLAAAFCVAGLSGAAAHSLEDVEKQLGERETYVELVERPAPGFALQDWTGQETRLSDYRGKVVVLWFIFASCTEACPLHSRVIADIQQQVNETPMRDRVQFVAITTDPARDTPEALKAYGPEQGLDAANWVFLTSGPDRPEDTTRQIAQDYGLQFAVTPDGDQVHGVVTHLIDREGVMRARYHGLKFSPTNLIVHINALTHDHHRDDPEQHSFWQGLQSWLPW